MANSCSLFRDLKRFAVEFLCLLLLLQGFPAQALERTKTPAPPERTAPTKVAKKARQVDAASLPPTTPFTSPKPGPAKRANKSIAPEITALADSFNGSPAAILRHVHDTILYDPKHGADSSPVGTLWEGRGTAWEQAWLLQELLLAAGVDARLEWGSVEIAPDLLTTLAGVDDPIRAADLLTTAGIPIVAPKGPNRKARGWRGGAQRRRVSPGLADLYPPP